MRLKPRRTRAAIVETITGTHHLSLAADEGCTVGECSCGQWRRQADLETVTLTGRSREEALRSAHDMHARGLEA